MINTLESDLLNFQGSECTQKFIIIEWDGEEDSTPELTTQERKDKGYMPSTLGMFTEIRD